MVSDAMTLVAWLLRLKVWIWSGCRVGWSPVPQVRAGSFIRSRAVISVDFPLALLSSSSLLILGRVSGVFVVGGAGLEAAVQDADQAVASRAQSCRRWACSSGHLQASTSSSVRRWSSIRSPGASTPQVGVQSRTSAFSLGAAECSQRCCPWAFRASGVIVISVGCRAR